jgi:hypothetical protein
VIGTRYGFLDSFKRCGGPDLVIIDDAYEGIRNYKSCIPMNILSSHDERPWDFSQSWTIAPDFDRPYGMG